MKWILKSRDGKVRHVIPKSNSEDVTESKGVWNLTPI